MNKFQAYEKFVLKVFSFLEITVKNPERKDHIISSVVKIKTNKDYKIVK